MRISSHYGHGSNDFTFFKCSKIHSTAHHFFLNSIDYRGQGRHGYFLEGKTATVEATSAAAAFYSAKSRQGLDLGGLASCGSPGM